MKLKALVLFLLPSFLFGADAAFDLIWAQRNSGNTGTTQRNVAPLAGGLLGTSSGKLPVPVIVGTGLSYDTATNTLNATGSGSGTVTTVSVVPANGFAGSVANATTTPAITLTTSITGILKGNATAISAATAGTDYEVPLTFSTGLTRSTNTITVNTSQNISTLSNLTSNGFVKTSGGTGALSIDTNTYLTTAVTSLTGTTAEISVSAATGAVTVSIPTNVTFSGKTITGGTYASPAVTTSLTTGSSVFALLNTTATTINFAGGTSTLNIGASASPMVLNFGGGSSASEFRFLEPSGGGANYTSFKAVAQAADIAYTLPNADGSSGYVLSTNGSGVLSWISAGTGTISSGTTNRLSKYTASTTLGNSLLSDDGTTLSYTGTGGISLTSSVAGATSFGAGTTPTAAATNYIQLQAPTSVTAYDLILPSSSSTGFLLGTNSSNVNTLTFVSFNGTGNVIRASGAAITSPTITTGITPTSNDGAALGSTSLQFSDLFLAEGGVINWDNGDATMTQTNNDVTIAGITTFGVGTSTAVTLGTIELGAASDTTVSRVAAGVAAVEGNILSMVAPRITTITSNATPTFSTDSCDVVSITALAAAITSMTTNMTGTFNNFQQLEFRILDNGTARAITWGANFASGIATLPTTTTANKALCVYFEYDSVQTKWMCQATGSYP